MSTQPVAAAPPQAAYYEQQPSPPAPPPPPPYAAAPPAPPPPPYADVEYDTQPPAVDIETYPSVVFNGAPAYFFGGIWWRHDGRGWAHYRVEPPQLERERRAHEREPRWVQARDRGRPGLTAPQPGYRPAPPREERH